MDAQIAKLKEWVDASDNIVFFGGAGVSTESGIPDFRSVDGLYNQQYKYPPETILSHTFFMSEPEEFFRFYRAKMLALDAKPNAAHLKLAEWERMGKCRAVITQNIDGLHQKAGSKEVLELHGSVMRNYCMRCHKPYDVRDIAAGTGVPKCELRRHDQARCGAVRGESGQRYAQPKRGLHPQRGHSHHRRHIPCGLPGSRADRLLPRQQAGAGQQIRHARPTAARIWSSTRRSVEVFSQL